MSKYLSNPNISGMFLAMTGYSFFSWADAILKFGTDTLTIAQIIFWNDVVALITVIMLAPFLGGWKATLASGHKKLHLGRSVFLTLQFFVILKAFSLMPLANVYAIMFCAPLVTSLLAFFIFKERADFLQWMSILIAFVGVLVILRPGVADFDQGFIYVFCSLLCLAIGNLFNRAIPHTETKFSFAFYPIMVTLFASIGVMVFEGFAFPDLKMSLLLCVSGILSGLAVMVLGMGFARAKIIFAAPMHYIQMIWGSLLGYLVFGDILDVWTGLGVLIIISGGLMLLKSSPQKDA